MDRWALVVISSDATNPVSEANANANANRLGDDSADTPYVKQARGRVGTVLKGKWRLDAMIGVGGMGAVYSSTHRNGSRAAIKALLPLHGADRVTVQRFLREGYVASELQHPGAVTIFDDDFTEDGLPFLVMELLAGESLAARLERAAAPLPAEQVVKLGLALLDVLAAAHDRGIVHRDVKPDNVFLVEDGGIKLLDFGIAQLRTLNASERVTATGALLGTPAFMSPEQARGRSDEVDARTDLWAVGATLYLAATGIAARQASSVNEVLLLAMTKPVAPVRDVSPSVPAAIAGVIDRALAFDKSDRWPNATEMRDALAAASHAPAASQAHVQQGSPPHRARRQKTLARAAAVAAIAAVVAALVVPRALQRSAITPSPAALGDTVHMQPALPPLLAATPSNEPRVQTATSEPYATAGAAPAPHTSAAHPHRPGPPTPIPHRAETPPTKRQPLVDDARVDPLAAPRAPASAAPDLLQRRR